MFKARIKKNMPKGNDFIHVSVSIFFMKLKEKENYG